MYYKKIELDDVTIEFSNDWLGRETVKINGQQVSKKTSLFGTNHDFTLMEEGIPSYYILTTKLNDNMEVILDIRRNGQIFMENIEVPMTFNSNELKNPFKKSGITKVLNYDIKEGISDLEEALKVKVDDPEIYFYMACGYSIEENVKEGIKCLMKAAKYNLHDFGIIKTHEMLAYLRMQEGYEAFSESNFTEYDKMQIFEEE